MTSQIDRRALALLALFPAAATSTRAQSSLREIMDRAFEMKRQAVAAGDQPYGAVLFHNGRIVAESPSRVAQENDRTAHAENSVIRDALKQGLDLRGATLYSTSIPCRMCQASAAAAGVARMIYGEDMTIGGAPQAR
jgi:tRNA(Arg) A34 adenosine deaminase TadA